MSISAVLNFVASNHPVFQNLFFVCGAIFFAVKTIDTLRGVYLDCKASRELRRFSGDFGKFNELSGGGQDHLGSFGLNATRYPFAGRPISARQDFTSN